MACSSLPRRDWLPTPAQQGLADPCLQLAVGCCCLQPITWSAGDLGDVGSGLEVKVAGLLISDQDSSTGGSSAWELEGSWQAASWNAGSRKSDGHAAGCRTGMGLHGLLSRGCQGCLGSPC